MKIYLKIENGIIEDVKFETFGCASAIASSSMATELINGKPVAATICFPIPCRSTALKPPSSMRTILKNVEKNKFVGKKEDVTNDAIAAVFEWFVGNMDGKTEYSITYKNTNYELVMREKTQ